MIKDGIWKGKNFYQLYKNAMTPREWHKELFQTAKDEGLICFSSPFSKQDVEFLEQFKPPAYKIASFEITDASFISLVASKNLPIIISTGIATKDEIKAAIKACLDVKNDKIILLKCTSSYPSGLEELNLNSIKNLQNYGYEIGLSDHSFGFLAPIIATSLGANVIEKHFIFDKGVKSEDSAFSLDFDEFKQMVKMVRDTKIALGNEDPALNLKNRAFARSLYLIKPIKKGEILTESHIRSVRPGYGLHPSLKSKVLGKRAVADVEKHEAIKIEMFH